MTKKSHLNLFLPVGIDLRCQSKDYPDARVPFQGIGCLATARINHCLKSAIIGILLTVCCYPGNAQKFGWTKGIGGNGADYNKEIAVDPKGNVYVTGYFGQAVDFNPGGTGGMLTPVGIDAFLAKYDPDGNYLWAKTIGGSGTDQALSLSVDHKGNVHVIGLFNAAINFSTESGTTTLTPIAGYDVFFSKYDPDGNCLWAKSIGNTGSMNGYGIAVDNDGHVLITGFFNQQTDFDPGTGIENRTPHLNASGAAPSVDMFIAKYDSAGNYTWAKNIGGPGQDEGIAIVTDEQGNLYVAGRFNQAVDFDPGNGTAIRTPAGYDAYVAKYDPNGNYVWVKSIKGTSFESAKDIAIDDNNNVYVTGDFQGTVTCDSGNVMATLVSKGLNDGYLAKYDVNGNYVWAINLGGTGYDYGQGVSVDVSNHVYVLGRSTAAFDASGNGDTIAAGATGIGSDDVFLIKYDSSSNYRWGIGAGGIGYDYGESVSTDQSGNVYIAGYFSRPLDFNPGGTGGLLTPAGNTTIDGFLVKFGCSDTLSSYLVVKECTDSFTLNEEVYRESGTYTQYFPNLSGCDSSVILDLTLYAFEQPVLTIDIHTLSTTRNYTTYQWIKNGEDIPGATNPTYTVTENADYQVRVTHENDCEGISDEYTVNNIVSIDKVNPLSQYTGIYPNPVNDILYVTSPVPVDAVLSTIEGRRIRFAPHAQAIPVKDLAKGMYLLRITDKNGTLPLLALSSACCFPVIVPVANMIISGLSGIMPGLISTMILLKPLKQISIPGKAAR
jgi:DNA-binding protein Fis